MLHQVPELEAGFRPCPNLEHVLAKVRRGQALLGADAAVPYVLGEWPLRGAAGGGIRRNQELTDNNALAWV